MPIKVNLYYNQADRDFVVDYNLNNHIIDQKHKLVLRNVDSEHARSFVNFVISAHPTFHDPKYFTLPLLTVIKFYDKHYNTLPRIKKIHVKHPESTVVIERVIGDMVPPGARYFCGKCGEVLCEAREYSELPFSVDIWRGKSDNNAYTKIHNGVVCEHCQQLLNYHIASVLFPIPYLQFADLNSFFEHQKKIDNETRT